MDRLDDGVGEFLGCGKGAVALVTGRKINQHSLEKLLVPTHERQTEDLHGHEEVIAFSIEPNLGNDDLANFSVPATRQVCQDDLEIVTHDEKCERSLI